MVKKMLIGVVAIVLGIAGAVSSAQAGNDKDEYDHGGIKIGPLGQVFGSPGVVVAPSQTFGQALPHQVRPTHKRTHTH